jgi:hypothetical protein
VVRIFGSMTEFLMRIKSELEKNETLERVYDDLLLAVRTAALKPR